MVILPKPGPPDKPLVGGCVTLWEEPRAISDQPGDMICEWWNEELTVFWFHSHNVSLEPRLLIKITKTKCDFVEEIVSTELLAKAKSWFVIASVMGS
jgi:hypothetical protein